MGTYAQDEWDRFVSAYPPGTHVTGEVTSRQIFGVFVRLDELPDVVALLEIIHFGLLANYPQHRLEFPSDYPAVGARIDARVLAWCEQPKDVRLTQLPHLNVTSRS